MSLCDNLASVCLPLVPSHHSWLQPRQHEPHTVAATNTSTRASLLNPLQLQLQLRLRLRLLLQMQLQMRLRL
jgi:hypothetical protein